MPSRLTYVLADYSPSRLQLLAVRDSSLKNGLLHILHLRWHDTREIMMKRGDGRLAIAKYMCARSANVLTQALHNLTPSPTFSASQLSTRYQTPPPL